MAVWASAGGLDNMGMTRTRKDKGQNGPNQCIDPTALAEERSL